MFAPSPRCFACGGPYHPASGHIFKGFEGVQYCGACFKPFMKWIAGHMKRKWSGASFYEEAVTSNRAPWLENTLLSQSFAPIT